MYARRPSAIKTPVTTTKMTKTTTAEESLSTGLLRFEEWKSYMNYLVYFRGQQLLEKEIKSITQMPEITRYSPFYIRFG